MLWRLDPDSKRDPLNRLVPRIASLESAQ